MTTPARLDDQPAVLNEKGLEEDAGEQHGEVEGEVRDLRDEPFARFGERGDDDLRGLFADLLRDCCALSVVDVRTLGSNDDRPRRGPRCGVPR